MLLCFSFLLKYTTAYPHCSVGWTISLHKEFFLPFCCYCYIILLLPYAIQFSICILMLISYIFLVQIKDGFAEGKDLVVSVMSAMGEEQICALKDIGPK